MMFYIGITENHNTLLIHSQVVLNFVDLHNVFMQEVYDANLPTQPKRPSGKVGPNYFRKMHEWWTHVEMQQKDYFFGQWLVEKHACTIVEHQASLEQYEKEY